MWKENDREQELTGKEDSSQELKIMKGDETDTEKKVVKKTAEKSGSDQTKEAKSIKCRRGTKWNGTCLRYIEYAWRQKLGDERHEALSEPGTEDDGF